MTNPISSFNSSVINDSVSKMSDTELCNVLKSITLEMEVETLIKCDQDSLDKIYKVKRDNVEDLISYSEDDETQRIIEIISDFQNITSPTFEDYMKITREMSIMINKLKDDNEKCKSDIESLEFALNKMDENFIMYKDDLCDDSLKVCKEKYEHTEGLIRLRRKMFETNTQSIKGLEKIIENIIDNADITDTE